MNWILILYTTLLFFILTPSVIVRLPSKGNKWTVALIHGLIFAVIYYITSDFVMKLGSNLEGNCANVVTRGDNCTPGTTGNFCELDEPVVPAQCVKDTSDPNDPSGNYIWT